MTGDSIQTLRCPSCGAPAASDAARCEYCRSRLATVSCPSCFGLLFDGAGFCQHCGAARSRSEASDERRTPCPACHGEMRWVMVGTTDLLECHACDGTWVEAATFEKLCADSEAQAAVIHPSPDRPAAASTRTETMRYRPCPRCRKLMNRVNFGKVSGAVVDVCRGHGTFLDRGELHQVVRFIKEGGMNRAREAQREQIVEEQRRLRDLERAQAHLAPASSPPAWNDRSLQDLLTALLGRR